jgi:hypothetical protein
MGERPQKVFEAVREAYMSKQQLFSDSQEYKNLSFYDKFLFWYIYTENMVMDEVEKMYEDMALKQAYLKARKEQRNV